LIEDIVQYHQKLEPAIRRLIAVHATWGSPLVLEGWALYPNTFEKDMKNVFAVWLIADENLLRSRLNANKDFYEYAKEPQKVLENYLYRSE